MKSSGNEGEEDGGDEEGEISTFLKSKNNRISNLPEKRHGLGMKKQTDKTQRLLVLVSAKEEPDLPICPAMDGFLSVHKRIVDVDSDSANAPSGAGGIVCTRFLLAANEGIVDDGVFLHVLLGGALNGFKHIFLLRRILWITHTHAEVSHVG